MRLGTVSQCQQIDKISHTDYDLSGELLMEAAGAIAAREIEQSFFPELNKGHVSIICGPGNNGGDGAVIARHLHAAGFRNLNVFVCGKESIWSPLLKAQVARLERQRIKVIRTAEQLNEAASAIHSSALLIDALFGIGLARPISGDYARLIDSINSTSAPAVSIDAPSGLDCDRGVVLGACVKAAMTITFGLAKPGFFVAEGPSFVGNLRIVSIGFPRRASREIAKTHFAFSERLARRALPVAKPTANKSDFGRLLVYAGGPGTWGAGLLCASAAARVGAGYVTLVGSVEPREAIRENPEFLTAQIDDPKLWQKKSDQRAVVIGPGFGVGEATAAIIEKLKKEQPEHLVLDADAITTCVQFNLWPLPAEWVMTPHAGELARIMNVAACDVESDRFNFAARAAQKAGCYVLLKGFRSVLSNGKKSLVIMAGNNALAKAGSGDVLAGMIGGLLAQGFNPHATPLTQAAVTQEVSSAPTATVTPEPAMQNNVEAPAAVTPQPPIAFAPPPPPPPAKPENVGIADHIEYSEKAMKITKRVETLFTEMQQLFSQCMLIFVHNNVGIPSYWDLNWHPKAGFPHKNCMLDQISIFSIVMRTKLPYHGYVMPNEANNRFFDYWNMSITPEHITIYPIILNDKVRFMLVGTAKNSIPFRQSLKYVNELAEKFYRDVFFEETA